MKPKVKTNEKYSVSLFFMQYFVISPINGEFCCCSFFRSDLTVDSIRLIGSIIHVEQCTAEILHGMMFALSVVT